MAAAPGGSPRGTTNTNAATCDQLREKGNVLYRSLVIAERGMSSLVAPTTSVRRKKITQAEHHYAAALSCSRTPAERVACLKNLGSLHLMWSRFEVGDAVLVVARPDSALLEYGKKKAVLGVGYLVNALDEAARSGAKPQAWLDHLRGVLMAFVDWTVDQTDALALRMPRAPLLRCVCEGFDLALGKHRVPCSAAVVAHLHLAERLFKHGMSTLDDEDASEPRDFSDCVSFTDDCLQVLRKARSFPAVPANCGGGGDDLILREIAALEKKAQTQILVCESMQARQMGDEVLRKAVKAVGNGVVNMQLALQAVDHYSRAASLAREHDMEAEAIAMSRQGRMFSEFIKDPARAYKAHYQATVLAKSLMTPRISRSSWYRYSAGKLAQQPQAPPQQAPPPPVVIRDEDQRRKEKQQRRSPESKKKLELKDLEEALRKLNLEAKKGGREFLEHVYQTHPNPDSKKELVESSQRIPETGLTKEILRKAISHYHPDVNGQHGEAWLVLCEEISKILNNKYDYLKLEKQASSSRR